MYPLYPYSSFPQYKGISFFCIFFFFLQILGYLDSSVSRNVSNVHEAWFANEDKVRKVVGLLDKTDTKLPKCGELPCGICFESY
ncbi:putative E3 ubiquitin ligase RBR family [Helianthus annuus]|nr:putative E3 ubiquitin ligase RBR family [Helianthus annuus]